LQAGTRQRPPWFTIHDKHQGDGNGQDLESNLPGLAGEESSSQALISCDVAVDKARPPQRAFSFLGGPSEYMEP
jgi:hypothetical protein